MQHLTCEFCHSRIGPIMPHDMGEGRVMHLCPLCRAYIAQGEKQGEGDELTYWQGYWDGLMRQDTKAIAKAVIAELPKMIRNATGKRNF